MAKKAIRPLRSESDYDAALAEIETYFDHEPRPGTPDADRFDLLALVIEDYERRHWPILAPDPVDAIRYGMELRGHSQADLGRLLGSRQRASDILARRRSLTLQMAWKLNREWGIPAEALIQPQTPVRPRGTGGSSVIRNFSYDPEREQLEITFTTEKVYVYEGVPSDVYERLSLAPSRGKFFNRYIRDAYAYADVTRLAG